MVKIIETYTITKYPSQKTYFNDDKFLRKDVFEILKDWLLVGKNIVDCVVDEDSGNMYWFLVDAKGDVHAVKKEKRKERTNDLAEFLAKLRKS